jgi:chaperonin GroEL (HSP60 family)
MKADELLEMGVHPNTIAQGFDKATKRLVALVKEKSWQADDGLYAPILECVDCGRNILTPTIRSSIIEASKTVIREGKVDDSRLKIVKKVGGSTDETLLIKGIAIKASGLYHGVLESIQSPRIALISGKIGLNRLTVMMKGEGPSEVELKIREPRHIMGYQSAEDEIKKAAIRKIVENKVNVVLCQQPVDDSVKSELVRKGIFVLESVNEKDLKAVAKATGAKIVSTPQELIESELGSASGLRVDRIPPDEIVVFEGCDAATFFLRGSTTQALDEVESLINNAMKVIQKTSKDGLFVPGGGAMEMYAAIDLRKYARQFAGREQIVIEYFADSIEEIPKVLAENAGLDGLVTMAQLSKLHLDKSTYGIGAGGCSEFVCSDPARIKLDIYLRANDLASMMLKINELWVSKEIVKVHKQ